MPLACSVTLLLLLASCNRAVATAPMAWPLADPASLGGTWQIELRRGSAIPLYENTPFNTRRPPWASGTLAFAESSGSEGTIRGDTIRGIARLEVRSRPGSASVELPDYPAAAVLSIEGRVWLRIDLAPQCREQACLRLLEFNGILSADQMRGDWKSRSGALSTSGRGIAYRDRSRGR